MAMLDDVFGGAAPGAGNRLCTTRSRRMGGLGAAPWWSGMSIAAVLICAGALVITSDAANARSSARSSAKASAKASAAPALDAKAVNDGPTGGAVGQRTRCCPQRGRIHKG